MAKTSSGIEICPTSPYPSASESQGRHLAKYHVERLTLQSHRRPLL